MKQLSTRLLFSELVINFNFCIRNILVFLGIVLILIGIALIAKKRTEIEEAGVSYQGFGIFLKASVGTTLVAFGIIFSLTASFFLPRCDEVKKERSKECIRVKKEAAELIQKIDHCLEKEKDKEQVYFLSHWKEECEKISNYECEFIDTSTHLKEVLYRTSIQLDSCKNH